MSATSLAALSLAAIRAAGPECTRRRLEVLVNLDLLGLAGAQKVYHDAFGDRLEAVADRSPEFRALLESEALS